MLELNYGEFLDEIVRKLEPAQQIVLATCADDAITTRLVCPLNDGLTIMISTGKNSLKIEQIRKNPRVALVLDGINIEATAELYGHPDDHPTFFDRYAKKYPEIVKTYKSTPDGMLVILKPTKVSIYQYTGKACKDILDVKAKRAYREEL